MRDREGRMKRLGKLEMELGRGRKREEGVEEGGPRRVEGGVETRTFIEI